MLRRVPRRVVVPADVADRLVDTLWGPAVTAGGTINVSTIAALVLAGGRGCRLCASTGGRGPRSSSKGRVQPNVARGARRGDSTSDRWEVARLQSRRRAIGFLFCPRYQPGDAAMPSQLPPGAGRGRPRTSNFPRFRSPNPARGTPAGGGGRRGPGHGRQDDAGCWPRGRGPALPWSCTVAERGSTSLSTTGPVHHLTPGGRRDPSRGPPRPPAGRASPVPAGPVPVAPVTVGPGAGSAWRRPGWRTSSGGDCRDQPAALRPGGFLDGRSRFPTRRHSSCSHAAAGLVARRGGQRQFWKRGLVLAAAAIDGGHARRPPLERLVEVLRVVSSGPRCLKFPLGPAPARSYSEPRVPDGLEESLPAVRLGTR